MSSPRFNTRRLSVKPHPSIHTLALSPSAREMTCHTHHLLSPIAFCHEIYQAARKEWVPLLLPPSFGPPPQMSLFLRLSNVSKSAKYTNAEEKATANYKKVIKKDIHDNDNCN